MVTLRKLSEKQVIMIKDICLWASVEELEQIVSDLGEIIEMKKNYQKVNKLAEIS